MKMVKKYLITLTKIIGDDKYIESIIAIRHIIRIENEKNRLSKK